MNVPQFHSPDKGCKNYETFLSNFTLIRFTQINPTGICQRICATSKFINDNSHYPELHLTQWFPQDS